MKFFANYWATKIFSAFIPSVILIKCENLRQEYSLNDSSHKNVFVGIDYDLLILVCFENQNKLKIKVKFLSKIETHATKKVDKTTDA